MKPNKKVAAVAAGALVASAGVASIALAGAASATTNSFHLYSQIKKTTLQSTSYDTGTVNVTMTVTPAAASPGTPLEIKVSSTDMFMKNGPAANAAALSEEADAVVNFNGVDYVLRGSQNAQSIAYDDSELGGTNTPNRLFDAGWVTSSVPGNSSSTSTNTFSDPGAGTPVAGTVAGTTGIGATVRGAEATPVSIVAPAVGSYTLTLKAIVVNAIAGSSTVSVSTDDFDNVYSPINCTASCAANGNVAQLNANNAASYITPFSPAVTLTSALLPDFTIDKITTQNNTYDIPGSSTTATAAAGGLLAPAPRVGDYITFTGTSASWTPSAILYGTVCTTAALTSCGPAGSEATLWGGTAGGYTMAAGFSTTTTAGGTVPTIQAKISSFGAFSGSQYLSIYQTTTRPVPPGFSGTNSNGPTSAGVTAAAAQKLYLLLATRTVAVTGAPLSNVASGANIPVTGSNFYPGESVTIGGADTAGAPVAGTSTTVTANASGGISGNATAASGVTRVYATGHGPTGDVTVLSPDGDVSVSLTSCSIVSPATSCTTAQSLYATVTAGLLSQAASLTNACVAPATSESPTLPSGPAFAPVNGCNSAVSKIGFGAVQTKSVAQTLTGTLNTITVTDLRGGLTGWSLVATVPAAFTNGGSGTIPANNITINTASCTPSVGSAPGCTPAAAAAVFNGVTLAQKLTGAGNLNAGGSTSGTYDVAATLDLNVPAFQPTGLYSTTATFTLS